MLLENSNPLQLKFSLLFARNNLGPAIPNQTIRGDTRRHSLIITSDAQFSVTLEGMTDYVFQSNPTAPTAKVLTYEEYGDLLYRSLIVAFNPGAVIAFIGHTIIEKPAHDGAN